MSKETRYAMYFISFMMSVKLHKYRIVTIYYQSELSGGHCRSAATMPLHVVCRGEECRSVTSVSCQFLLNQEKAPVIVKTVCENDVSFAALAAERRHN